MAEDRGSKIEDRVGVHAAPVRQCPSMAIAKEKDFPMPIALRCTEPKGHRGMHTAVERNLDWEWQPLEGAVHTWLVADLAEFAWFNGQCWWRGIWKIRDTAPRWATSPKMEPDFAMMEIEQTEEELFANPR